MKTRSSPRSAYHRQSACGASRIYAGQLTNRRQEFALKRDLALDGIAGAWQRDLHCQESLRLEAVVDAREGGHRSDEQPGPTEEHDGHPHLPNDKQLPDAWRVRDPQSARMQ